MIAVVQRAREASVTVEGTVVGRIGPGLLVLLGVHETDTRAEADWLARKVAGLRIFADAAGKMNRSVAEAGGEVLVVSQFTLYGDTRKGFRPSFIAAAPPEHAEPLYRYFCDQIAAQVGRAVPTGQFGAMMDVALINDGPVTLIVERRADA